MIKTISVSDPKYDAAKLRNATDIPEEIIQRTKAIMDDVIKYGDSAILQYTQKFDGAEINSLKVTREEIDQAYQNVTSKQIRAIEIIKNRLLKSESALLKRLSGIRVALDGVTITRRVVPVSSVGCYIPGGKARYPSTAIMCAVPAKAAGVKRIIAVSPPLGDGKIDPLTLVAADICGVDEFYKAGGAQGIAALAYGSQTIKKVDKIVGPGGIFVTVAKMIASNTVSTDMIAGPTELLIYADSSADPRIVALDLVSQAEHSYDTMCGLVTTSNSLASSVIKHLESILTDISRREIVQKSLSSNGFIALCNSEESAIQFCNELAPEHLEIMSTNSSRISKKIVSSGLVLLDKYTPSSASDYCLGSNHVIPTLGFAKSRASLSIIDFIKIVNIVKANKKGLAKVESCIKEIATSEGLINHYRAVEGRL